MAEFMKSVARFGSPLTMEERTLLSVAYKNVVGMRRSSWRLINSMLDREAMRSPDSQRLTLLRAYRRRIEQEIRGICYDILDVLDQHLIRSAATADSRVQYLKMQADYHRFLAEFLTGEERTHHVDQGQAIYQRAYDLAAAELEPTHPIRLGVALNFSVFQYEILARSERACEMAKKAFDEAIYFDLNQLVDEDYKDTTWILQLLRDNLALWTSEQAEET